jgi:hypothetical protein
MQPFIIGLLSRLQLVGSLAFRLDATPPRPWNCVVSGVKKAQLCILWITSKPQLADPKPMA